MIILDTNVLSEMLRPAPDGNVLLWMARQAASQLFTTCVTEAEIRYGIARMPEGRKRSLLAAAVDGIFGIDLAGRVLPFDSDAARAYAGIVSQRERAGRPISQFDAQIAAVARAHGAAIATRNVSDFEDCGVALVDPWKA